MDKTNLQDRLEFTLGMLCRTYGTLYMEAIFTPGSKPVVMIVSSRWDYEGDDNLCDAMCRTYGTLYMEAMLTPGSKPVVMIVTSCRDYEGDDNLCDVSYLRYSMRNEVSPVRTKHK